MSPFHALTMERSARIASLEHVLPAVEGARVLVLGQLGAERRCACRSPGCRRRRRAASRPACPAASAPARVRPPAPGARTPCSRPRRRRSPSSPAGVLSSRPMPKSSTPALLPTMVSPFTPLSHQRLDQVLRDAAQAEAAGGDRHVVVQQPVQRVGGVRLDFFHRLRTFRFDLLIRATVAGCPRECGRVSAFSCPRTPPRPRRRRREPGQHRRAARRTSVRSSRPEGRP